MSETTEHHTNYILIYGILVAALWVSVAITELSASAAAVAAVFVIAAIKAYMVLIYFIQLRLEPRFIQVLVGGALLALVVLFAGFYADIAGDFGREVAP